MRRPVCTHLVPMYCANINGLARADPAWFVHMLQSCAVDFVPAGAPNKMHPQVSGADLPPDGLGNKGGTVYRGLLDMGEGLEESYGKSNKVTCKAGVAGALQGQVR